MKNPFGSPPEILNMMSELGPELSASEAPRGGVVIMAVPWGAFSARVAV